MQLISKKIVMTKDIGIHGNLFGGILMAWLDEAGASLATEFCRTPYLVTVKIGELIFNKPVKSGNHLRIYGKVLKVGTSSIKIFLEARKFNLYSGEEILVCNTDLTFVRVDEDGHATPIDKAIVELHRAKLPNVDLISAHLLDVLD
jgi:acyl-CoA thioesterase YciA